MVEDVNLEKISTGSFDLNDFLEGGYERDIITMIAGPPGSGKTNLGILAACSQANKDKKVIFVDSEGGFSLDRVKQIVGDKYESILGNILLFEPTSFKEQAESFKKLLEHVKKGHVDLIVIDSMAMLYRLELGDAVKSGKSQRIQNVNREIAQQMRDLAEISRKQKIPVLITNQVYSNFVSWEDRKKILEVGTNIIGGDLFKYWCKCILELKKESGQRKVVLLKHRSLPEKEMNFEIKENGIFKKKGWL